MSTLERLFEFNRWANLEMVKACRQLSPEQLDQAVPGLYGSVRATLVHIAAAESRYVSVLASADPTVKPVATVAEDATLDEISAALAASGSALLELARTLDGEQRVLRRSARLPQPQSLPAWVILGQAIAHGCDHRSQLATALTLFGFTPPELDLWAYAEEEGVITLTEN